MTQHYIADYKAIYTDYKDDPKLLFSGGKHQGLSGRQIVLKIKRLSFATIEPPLLQVSFLLINHWLPKDAHMRPTRAEYRVLF